MPRSKAKCSRHRRGLYSFILGIGSRRPQEQINRVCPCFFCVQSTSNLFCYYWTKKQFNQLPIVMVGLRAGGNVRKPTADVHSQPTRELAKGSVAPRCDHGMKY